MSASSPRLGRVVILAVAGATALSLGACSTTSTPTSATTSPSTVVASPTTTPPSGEAQVSGLIASVANNSAQVTQKSGTAKVNFTDSTKITESTAAALTDVTPGSCVSVRPTHGAQGGDPITAASVRISPAADGKCPPPPPGMKRPIAGTVASVAGNTINVTSTDASGPTSQTAVTVNDKTKYTKQAAANTQAITAGKCITAKGTKDGNGALQATTIDLRAANHGKCKGRDRDR